MEDYLYSSDYNMNMIGLFLGIPESAKRCPKNLSQNLEKYLDFVKMNCEKSKSLDDHLGTLVKQIIRHYKSEKLESISDSKMKRIDPKKYLSGNYCSWKLYKNALRFIKNPKLLKNEQYHNFLNKITYATQSAIRRSGSTLSAAQINLLTDKMISLGELASVFDILEKYFRDEIRNAITKENLYYKYTRNGESIPERDNAKIKRAIQKWEGPTVVSVGGIVIHEYKNEYIVCSHAHFYRFISLLQTSKNLILTSLDMGLTVNPEDLLTTLYDIFEPVIEQDVDLLGEVIKGARNYLVAQLDKLHLFTNDPAESLLRTYDDEKQMMVRNVASNLRSITCSHEDAINLANLYKFVPHPDTNMQKVFETIEGLHNPNKPDPIIYERFEGIMRRSLYKSLTGQGYDVRLKARSVEGQHLSNLSEDTKVNVQRMMNVSYTNWAEVEFRKIQTFPEFKDIKVNISSKASQLNPEMEIPKQIIGPNGDMTSHASKFSKSAKTVNDAASYIKGESNFDVKGAIDRFKNMMRMHELFEEQFPGMLPEDIPDKDFIQFVESNPEATYIVGTEPKFGEYHKKVSRLFYMGEQQLKTLTQRIERIARQVSKKQFGVSIVKSYSARRQDLEEFAKSMLTVVSDMKPVYISFDMSEFSKKFPMELMRRYGKLLAEITGEEWLERIDIIFRASVVIHNTRGFFDILTGVKGGFEGFFNFIWSSIHAVIMEMSLDATGLQGNLLTFSDDGLLMLFISTMLTKADLKNHIENIKHIYSLCGLVFHLTKTLVSENVWEYLGDICLEGKLLNMWVKEVTSFSKNPEKSGLTPIYMSIQTLEGQADAMVKAGGNPITAFILKHIYFSSKLERIYGKYDPKLFESMSIIPTSCGGLRITSPFEMCIRTTYEKDAEVLADFLLLKKTDKNLSNTLLLNMYTNLKYSKSALKAFLRGSRFAMPGPDITGHAIVRDAILEAIDNHGINPILNSDPFTKEFETMFEELIMASDNIDIQLVEMLIKQVPSYVAFMDSVSVMRGGGAIRLISRKSIRIYQAKDRKIVTNYLSYWDDVIKNNMTDFNLKLNLLIDSSRRTVFRNANLAQLKPSARNMLTLVDHIGDIQVRVETDKYRSVGSADYIEPRIHWPTDFTTLAWSSERTADQRTKSIKKFANIANRIITSNPTSEIFVRTFALTIGIDLPVIPPAIIRGAHRALNESGTSLDVTLFLPRYYQSCSVARYMGFTARRVYEKARADRTTYLESAKVLTYLNWYIDNPLIRNGEITADIKMYYYDIPEDFFEVMHTYQEMTTVKTIKLLIKGEQLDEISAKEYQNTFMENSKFLEHLATLRKLEESDVKYKGTDLDFVVESSITGLKNWIKSIYKMAKNVIIPFKVYPTPALSQRKVVRTAIIQAAFEMMNVHLSNLLQRDILNFDKEYMSREDYIKFSSTAQYEEYITCLHAATTIVNEAMIPGLSERDIRQLMSEAPDVIEDLSKFFKQMKITDPGKIFVVRSQGYSPGQFSNSHRATYERSFKTTLTYIFNELKKNNWSSDYILRNLNIDFSPDFFIDMMLVAISMFRASKHRYLQSPYNKQSFKIMLAKFYLIMVKAAEALQTSIEVEKQLETRTLHHEPENVLETIMEVDEGEQEELETSDSEDENWTEQPIRITNGKLSIRDLKEFVQCYTISDQEREYLKSLSNIKIDEIGPDHAKLIEQELPRSLVTRIVYLLSMAYKNKKVIYRSELLDESGRFREERELNACITNFYEVIVVPAAKKIVDYNNNLDIEILTNFRPSTQADVSVLEIDYDHAAIPLEPIKIEGLNDEEKHSFSLLMSEHIKEFVIRNSTPGVKPIGPNEGFMERACSHFNILNGAKVAYLSDKANLSKADVFIGLFISNKVYESLATYANLSSLKNSVVSIFRDKNTSSYIVTSVTYPFDTSVIGQKYLTPPKIPHIKDPDLIISSATIESKTNQLSLNSMNLLRSAYNPTGQINTTSIVSNYMRVRGSAAFINNTSAFLQAASILATESTSSHNKFQSYIGLMSWLGNLNESSRKSLAKKLRIMLNDEKESTAINIDIGVTFSWIYAQKVNAGINLHPSEVRAALEELRSYKSPKEITLAAISLSLNSPSDAKFEFEKKRTYSAIGNLAKFLYVKPANVLAIKNEEYEEDTDILNEEDEANLENL